MIKEQLIKAMRRKQIVDMIYLSKDGVISKRHIKIVKMFSDSFQAFCFTRYAKRTFSIDNVLAVVPVIDNKRDVV